MIKTLFVFLVATLVMNISHGQDFTGYRTGNYTGVNGTFFNPANIADSRYRFDFNLFSVSSNVSNNQAAFSLKNISESFNGDSIANKVLGKNGGLSSGFISTDLHGPSIMFNAGKKMAIALTTRARVMANITNIDGKLVDKISSDFESDPTLPYTISSTGNMKVNVNAWTEYGLTVGRVLRDKGQHFLKAGVTLNYLSGAGNAYINVANLKATINADDAKQDAYLSSTTGKIGTGFGGVEVSDLEVSELTKMESKGFGTNIGFVYEWRPNHESYKKDDGSGWKRNMNKYKLKVGVAILDLGNIKYEKDMDRSGSYNINVTGNERFYLSELNGKEIDDYKSYFDTTSAYFTADNSNSESSYKVSLPTTLHINIDYHLHRGFYVSLGSQLSLINRNKTAFNSSYYNSLTVTPRYEGKGIGLYVPVSYNGLTKMNAGVSLRFGPLFVGSASLLSAALGESKQMDVHVGLRFGSLF